jgi:hypothetical protein
VEINKDGNLPCAFATQLGCSLVADRCGIVLGVCVLARPHPDLPLGEGTAFAGFHIVGQLSGQFRRRFFKTE